MAFCRGQRKTPPARLHRRQRSKAPSCWFAANRSGCPPVGGRAPAIMPRGASPTPAAILHLSWQGIEFLIEGRIESDFPVHPLNMIQTAYDVKSILAGMPWIMVAAGLLIQLPKRQVASRLTQGVKKQAPTLGPAPRRLFASVLDACPGPETKFDPGFDGFRMRIFKTSSHAGDSRPYPKPV